MEERIVEVNGVRSRLCVWGDNDGWPPLLLLHAGGEDSESWKSLAEQWARSRRVYAIDLRGHGQSARTGSYSLELIRDDVLGLLDILALDEVWIVGHSLGGMIGYLIASQGRTEVKRLVLEEAPPPLPLEPAREIPEDPGEDFGFDWKFITDVYPQRNEPDPAWWSDLFRIDIPVLVIAGGESSHVDQTEMRDMAGQIPGAELISIDAGHNVHATCPDEFLTAVDAFFDRATTTE